METIHGNKLVAEFMGYKLVPSYSPFLGNCWRKENLKDSPLYQLLESNEESQLWFHLDYRWIIPVFEKISNAIEVEKSIIDFKSGKTVIQAIQLPLSEDSYKHKLLCLFIVGENATSMIESVWLAVVQFIEWHNKNK